MGLSQIRAPIPPSYRQNTQLSNDNRSPNRRRNLLTSLDPKPHMTLTIPNNHNCLEPRTLPRPRLLLHRFDLHDLIFEFGQEEVDDLVFLDGEGVKVDFLHGFDLAGFDEPAQFGDWLPFLLFGLVAGSATSSATTTASAAPTSVAAGAESTASATVAAAGGGRWGVCHVVVVCRV